MASPGVITGKNQVIASVQTSPQVIPDFQESTSYPETRPNGGDLIAGDLWWSPEDEYLYAWTGLKWAPVNVIPNLRVNTDVVDLIDESLDDTIKTQQQLNKNIVSVLDQLQLSIDNINKEISDLKVYISDLNDYVVLNNIDGIAKDDLLQQQINELLTRVVDLEFKVDA